MSPSSRGNTSSNLNHNYFPSMQGSNFFETKNSRHGSTSPIIAKNSLNFSKPQMDAKFIEDLKAKLNDEHEKNLLNLKSSLLKESAQKLKTQKDSLERAHHEKISK